MDPEANNIPVSKPQQPRGGYASLSQFITSDKALCIFRRFDALAIRNLLYMQDELCEIEQQLGKLDDADMVSKSDIDVYSLHSRRFDKNEKRVALMQKAAETLRSYGKSRMAQMLFCIFWYHKVLILPFRKGAAATLESTGSWKAIGE